MTALNPDQYTLYLHVLNSGDEGLSLSDLATLCYSTWNDTQRVLDDLVRSGHVRRDENRYRIPR